ncbi:MAG: response regulator transcription factor [bacterium]|nr:response regulator transcription factor [bacterium]
MNVLIVDDDHIVSLSLKTILEAKEGIHVVGVGNNGKDAIKMYELFKPDVLLMDIRMDDMTGLEAATKILKTNKSAKILFLTTFSDDEYIIQALTIGAKGYILKQDFDSIVPAIQAVEKGQSVFGGEIVSKLPSILNTSSGFNYKSANISDKELEIIALVADGLNNKEISEKVFLSEGTIRNYLSNILDKLKVRDRTQLAIFYLRNRQK